MANMTKQQIVEATLKELDYAMTMYPPFASAHEGISVLREEFEETWEEVKVRQGKRNVEAMRNEAIQTAAMALRFAIDICSTEEAGQK